MATQKKSIAQILGSVIEKEAFEKSFAAHVPYIGIIDNIFYFDNERAGFMFEFKPVDNFRMDDYEFHSLKKNLDGFLNQIDQDLVMQIKVVKNGYFDDLIQSHALQNKSAKKLVDEIFNKRIEKITTSINKYEIFKYSYIISFSKKINILNASSMEAFFKAPETITADWEKQFKLVHQSITELVEKIGTSLKAAGLNIKIPSHQETIDHIATSINLIPTKIDCTPDEVVYPEDLINSCISKNYSHIYLNDKYVKIISIKKSCPPKDVITFSKIIDLYNHVMNFDLELMVTIQKQNMEAVVRNLEMKQSMAHSLKHGLGDKTIVKFEVQEEQVTELLLEYANGQNAAFEFELLIMVKADDPNSLRENCNAITSMMTKIGGMRGFVETYATFDLYKCFWIGNNDLKNQRNLSDLKTDNISDFLPIFGPPESTNEAVAIFVNQWNSLTSFNPLYHNYANKNGLIIGGTGQGKSFLMNLLIQNYLGIDPDIIFIEQGDSFEKIVKTFDGEYFNITSDVSINPFSIEADEKRMFWESMIQIMVRDIDKTQLDNDEKTILSELFDSLEKVNNVSLKTVLEELNKLKFEHQIVKEKHDRLCRHLKRWTKGALGKFVYNEKSSLDVSSKIMGFNLKGLDSAELEEIFMNYISNVIWSKLNKEPKRIKIIVFDEVWSFFNSDIGVKLITGLYRTIRKHHGALITISQDIGTYAENEKLKNAILSNVGFFYTLKQSTTGDYEQLQNILHLSNREVDMITKMQTKKGFYSESFIRTPDQPGFVGRSEPHPFSYWVATTDPLDKNAFDEEYAIQDKKSHSQSMTKQERKTAVLIDTINVLAKKYPHGFSNS